MKFRIGILFQIRTWVFLTVSFMAVIGHSSGWVSRGGGSGVACFESIADAARARSVQSALPLDLRQKIISLQTTDLWLGEKEHPPVPVLPGEVNADMYFQRVVGTYFQILSPRVTNRIKSAMAAMNFRSALAQPQSGPLERVFDTGKINGLDYECDETKLNCDRRLPDNCALVQLAVRESSKTPDNKASHKVSIDSDLYQKLGMSSRVIDKKQQIQNQAALRVHEVFYLIGFELEHQSSGRISQLVPILLSAKLAESLRNIQMGQRSDSRATAYALIHLFALSGLAELPLIPTTSPSPLREELVAAYLSLEKKLERVVKKTMDLSSLINNNEFLEIFNYEFAQVTPQLSNAESFVSLAQVAFLRGYVNDFYEIIDSPQEFTVDIARVCSWLEDNLSPQGLAVNRNTPVAKASCYCKQLGLLGQCR